MSNSRMKAVLIGFVAGPLIGAWGLWWLFDNTQWIKRAIPGVGVVLKINYVRGGRGSSYFELLTKFYTAQKHEILTTIKTNQENFFEGQPITFFYNQYDPQDARMTNFQDFWETAVILSGLGTIFIFGGIQALLKK